MECENPVANMIISNPMILKNNPHLKRKRVLISNFGDVPSDKNNEALGVNDFFLPNDDEYDAESSAKIQQQILNDQQPVREENYDADNDDNDEDEEEINFNQVS